MKLRFAIVIVFAFIFASCTTTKQPQPDSTKPSPTATAERPPRSTGSITGKVIAVSDGDTLKVLDENNVEHKIRLKGIDAPEKKQDFGQKSKDSLSELVFGKTVTIDNTSTDRYDRTVGKVIIENNKDVNLEQIRRGMAWFYKDYSRELNAFDKSEYAKSEELAKNDKKGLWSNKRPQAPWDYRKKQREN